MASFYSYLYIHFNLYFVWKNIQYNLKRPKLIDIIDFLPELFRLFYFSCQAVVWWENVIIVIYG